MAQTNQDTRLTGPQRLNLLPDNIRLLIEYTDGIRDFVNQYAQGGNAIANQQQNAQFQNNIAWYTDTRGWFLHFFGEQPVAPIEGPGPVPNQTVRLRIAMANMVRGFTMQLRDVYQPGVNQAADHFVNSFNGNQHQDPFNRITAFIGQHFIRQNQNGQPFSHNLLQSFRDAVQGNVQAINHINNLRGVPQLHLNDDGSIMLNGNNGNNQGPPNGGGLTGAPARPQGQQLQL